MPREPHYRGTFKGPSRRRRLIDAVLLILGATIALWGGLAGHAMPVLLGICVAVIGVAHLAYPDLI